MAVEHCSCERQKARAKEKWRFLGCQLSIFDTPRSGEPQGGVCLYSKSVQRGAGAKRRALEFARFVWSARFLGRRAAARLA